MLAVRCSLSDSSLFSLPSPPFLTPSPHLTRRKLNCGLENCAASNFSQRASSYYVAGCLSYGKKEGRKRDRGGTDGRSVASTYIISGQTYVRTVGIRLCLPPAPTSHHPAEQSGRSKQCCGRASFFPRIFGECVFILSRRPSFLSERTYRMSQPQDSYRLFTEFHALEEVFLLRRATCRAISFSGGHHAVIRKVDVAKVHPFPT